MSDEVTGLHAFDDLDPVSTVSALNMVPEEPEEPKSGSFGSDDALRSGAASPFPPARSFGPPLASRGLPPPNAPGRSAPPPPPLVAARRASSLPPPPPRGGLGGRSVPPPPPRSAASDAPPSSPAPSPLDEVVTAADDDSSDALEGDTKVVVNAFANDPDFARGDLDSDSDPATNQFESFASTIEGDEGSGPNALASGEPPSSRRPQSRASSDGIDDTALLELSATTVATNIDMDWDEEDVQTKLRDEHAVSATVDPAETASPLLKPMPGAASSPFETARPRSSTLAPGNPSPFAVRSSLLGPPLPEGLSWEDDDEAMTRVRPSGAPPPGSGSWPPAELALPAGAAVGRFDEVADFGRRSLTSLSRDRLVWAGGAAIALLVFALLVKTLLASPEPATVTLVTEPADAEVVVDGRVLVGQTSPFTVQGLLADGQHVIDVRKSGYSPQSYRFSIGEGEVKALPSIDLAPVRVDTGFALHSVPTGATVYVDGKKLEQATPARVTDLGQGLHLIRLEQGAGYQPWETQVALATGQVIELPVAHLVPTSGAGAANARRAASISRSEREDTPRVAPRKTSGRSRRASARGSSRTSYVQAPVAQPMRPMVQPRLAAPQPVVGAPTVGGRGGSLRINSRPWAQIFVDGRLVGNTPQLNIPLSAGSHDVKLVNRQLGMGKGFSVRIRAGKTTTKIVELIN